MSRIRNVPQTTLTIVQSVEFELKSSECCVRQAPNNQAQARDEKLSALRLFKWHSTVRWALVAKLHCIESKIKMNKLSMYTTTQHVIRDSDSEIVGDDSWLIRFKSCALKMCAESHVTGKLESRIFLNYKKQRFPRSNFPNIYLFISQTISILTIVSFLGRLTTYPMSRDSFLCVVKLKIDFLTILTFCDFWWNICLINHMVFTRWKCSAEQKETQSWGRGKYVTKIDFRAPSPNIAN